MSTNRKLKASGHSTPMAKKFAVTRNKSKTKTAVKKDGRRGHRSGAPVPKPKPATPKAVKQAGRRTSPTDTRESNTSKASFSDVKMASFTPLSMASSFGDTYAKKKPNQMKQATTEFVPLQQDFGFQVKPTRNRASGRKAPRTRRSGSSRRQSQSRRDSASASAARMARREYEREQERWERERQRERQWELERIIMRERQQIELERILQHERHLERQIWLLKLEQEREQLNEARERHQKKHRERHRRRYRASDRYSREVDREAKRQRSRRRRERERERERNRSTKETRESREGPMDASTNRRMDESTNRRMELDRFDPLEIEVLDRRLSNLHIDPSAWSTNVPNDHNVGLPLIPAHSVGFPASPAHNLPPKVAWRDSPANMDMNGNISMADATSGNEVEERDIRCLEDYIARQERVVEELERRCRLEGRLASTHALDQIDYVNEELVDFSRISPAIPIHKELQEQSCWADESTLTGRDASLSPTHRSESARSGAMVCPSDDSPQSSPSSGSQMPQKLSKIPPFGLPKLSSLSPRSPRSDYSGRASISSACPATPTRLSSRSSAFRRSGTSMSSEFPDLSSGYASSSAPNSTPNSARSLKRSASDL